MDSAIEWLINEIVAVFNGTARTSGLTTSMANYSPDLYKFVSAVSNTAIKPTAYVILAMFMLLELQRLSIKIEGSGSSTVANNEIFKSIIKMGFCKLGMDSTTLILNIINEVSVTLASKVKVVATGYEADSINAITKDIINNITATSFWAKIVILLVLFLAMCIAMMSSVFVQVICAMRFLQIYIYVGVAPLVMATLPSNEFSSVAKNFLKSFVGVNIQGILIIIVMYAYPYLQATAFSNLAESGSLWIMLGTIMGFGILMIVAIMSTNSWAKSISNAM